MEDKTKITGIVLSTQAVMESQTAAASRLISSLRDDLGRLDRSMSVGEAERMRETLNKLIAKLVVVDELQQRLDFIHSYIEE